MKDTCGKHHEGAYFLRHKHFSFHESCLATSLTNYFFIVPAVNCIHAYTSQLNQQLLFHCYIFLQRNLRDGLKKQIHIYIAANTITFSPLLTRLFDVIMVVSNNSFYVAPASDRTSKQESSKPIKKKILPWVPRPAFDRYIDGESVEFFWNKNYIHSFVEGWIDINYWKLHPTTIISSFIRKRTFEYVSTSLSWWLFCTRHTPIEKTENPPSKSILCCY